MVLELKRFFFIFSIFAMSFVSAGELPRSEAGIRGAALKAVPFKAFRQFKLRFNVVPREIKSIAGRTKVTVAAVLQPLFGVPKAEIVASIIKGKKKFVYSSQLKKFIHDHALTASMFKSIEDYLIAYIKKGEANPSLLLADLKTFLENGQAPTFSVTFEL